jgi:phage terminase large subunit GpA-like protein
MKEWLQDLSALREVEEVLADIFVPPQRLKPSEWAEVHRHLSREANAKGGKWHNMPMQVAPMDSVVDPEVRSTVVMWASQTAGKTEMLLNITGYFIDQEPSSILMIQPTLEMAETWSKDRFSPMVRDTAILNELVDDKKSRSSVNTILHKTFPAGHLTVAGANSAASLASRPIRVNLFDEVDRFPESAGREGDPISLAEKRADTFFNCVSFKTSTPTVKGHSRIEKEFLASDQNYWYAICPRCRTAQRLIWSQVKWKSEAKHDLEKAYYECAHHDCGAHWDDATRCKAIRAGHWRAHAPFNGIRGYHLNGIYSLFRPKKGFKSRLQQMAVEFLEARKKGKQTLKVWVNTFLAETWEEEADVKTEWSKLAARREKYDALTVPLGVRLITAGTDFQADRIEVEFVGHGVGEETWGLGHFQLWGDPRKMELYQRLEALLIQQFRRVDGAILRCNAAGFDTGYAACQRELYAWLRPRLGRRYYAFKGSSVRNAEPIGMAAKSKVERVRLIMVGTNRIKAYIYSRASIEVPGPGYMHFPESYTDEWFKQLLSEESRSVTLGGQEFKEFKQPEVTPDGGTPFNEALDLRVYALAALYARGGANWDYEERQNLQTIVQVPSESSPEGQVYQPQHRLKRPQRKKSRLISSLLSS